MEPPPAKVDMKLSIKDESRDVQRAYKTLTRTDGLRDAFIEAVETFGKSSQAIADRLFSENPEWGCKGGTAPYDSAVISRMRKALSYLTC